jgi:rhodanese-related sulfurtransferase
MVALACIAGMILLVQIYSILQRYVPVYGVSPIDIEHELREDKVALVDVRDYNTTANMSIDGDFHIPYAYLNRHYKDIQKKEVVLVVSDTLLLNLSVRFLRKKGYTIKGYHMIAD